MSREILLIGLGLGNKKAPGRGAFLHLRGKVKIILSLLMLIL